MRYRVTWCSLSSPVACHAKMGVSECTNSRHNMAQVLTGGNGYAAHLFLAQERGFHGGQVRAGSGKSEPGQVRTGSHGTCPNLTEPEPARPNCGPRNLGSA
eukprot:4712821-Prymnesium_polylepis.1